MTFYYYNQNPSHTQFRLAKEGDRYYLERKDSNFGSGYTRWGHFVIPDNSKQLKGVEA